MTLKEMLMHRRSVRLYDADRPIDTGVVRECLELAALAPTSSNMQLWECYHVTDPDVMKRLAEASLSQTTATSAQQMVVFVTRRDLHRRRAAAVLAFERGNVERNSPAEKHASRIKTWEQYYTQLIPMLYSRCCGLKGALLKMLFVTIGLFKPFMRQVSEGDIRTIVHKSCGLVAQTFMIAMAERGYDTCPVEGFDSLRVKRILKLPRGAGINMIVTCGIRKEGGVWGDRFRVPFDESYRLV